jgi:hypothetical protein
MEQVLETEFNNIVTALHALKPGERMVYFQGDLAYDRDDHQTTNKSDLNFIANTAFDLWRDGKVCLTQCRVSHFAPGNPPVFDYIATGSTPPYRKNIEPVREKIMKRKVHARVFAT